MSCAFIVVSILGGSFASQICKRRVLTCAWFALVVAFLHVSHCMRKALEVRLAALVMVRLASVGVALR